MRLCLRLLALFIGAKAASWTRLDPSGPKPLLSQHNAVWSPKDRGFYIFSGTLCCQKGSSNDLFFYNPQENAWLQMTPLGDVPSPRHACVVVWSDLDDGFYVFGGWVPDTDRRFSNELYFWSRENNTFHRMNATGDAPEPRDDGGGAWVGNGIVIFGGQAGNVSADDWWMKEDTAFWSRETNSWEHLAGGPVPGVGVRSMLMLWSDELQGVVAFGGTAFVGFFLKLYELAFFSMETKQWSILQPNSTQPSPRSDPGGVMMGRTLYIFGGEDQEGMRLNDVWSYSWDTNKWMEHTAVGELPRIRYRMVLITEPGNSSGFYMHGGFDMRSTNWDLWWLSLEAPEEEELVTGAATFAAMAWTLLVAQI